jgi:hypothetical protein
MPTTRGFDTIVEDLGDLIEMYSQEWERIQFKKRRGRPHLKSVMDDIVRVIQKLKLRRRVLLKINEKGGNCRERQIAKEILERGIMTARRSLDALSRV